MRRAVLATPLLPTFFKLRNFVLCSNLDTLDYQPTDLIYISFSLTLQSSSLIVKLFERAIETEFDLELPVLLANNMGFLVYSKIPVELSIE